MPTTTYLPETRTSWSYHKLSGTFAAKYAGKCAISGRRILPGDPIFMATVDGERGAVSVAAMKIFAVTPSVERDHEVCSPFIDVTDEAIDDLLVSEANSAIFISRNERKMRVVKQASGRWAEDLSGVEVPPDAFRSMFSQAIAFAAMKI